MKNIKLNQGGSFKVRRAKVGDICGEFKTIMFEKINKKGGARYSLLEERETKSCNIGSSTYKGNRGRDK